MYQQYHHRYIKLDIYTLLDTLYIALFDSFGMAEFLLCTLVDDFRSMLVRVSIAHLSVYYLDATGRKECAKEELALLGPNGHKKPHKRLV